MHNNNPLILTLITLIVSLTIGGVSLAMEEKTFKAEDANNVPISIEEYYSLNQITMYHKNASTCSYASYSVNTGVSLGDGFSTPGDIILKGSNNAEKIMNFLLEQGFSQVSAAGIMGNASFESGFSPTAENPSSKAYGIFQWLDRRSTLEEYGGDNYRTLEVQVQFMMFELSGTESAALSVRDATTAGDAAEIWDRVYERSELTHIPVRRQQAEAIYTEWQKSNQLSDDFLRTLGATPSEFGNDTSAGQDSNCTGAGGQTFMGSQELIGYAFPIAITSKKSISSFGSSLNSLPCTGTCHHDGTFAFDLGVTGYGQQDSRYNPNSIGAPVYAISDGVITNRTDNGTGPDGHRRTNCTQYTLLSDKDGQRWWYGHLMLEGAAVQVGQRVTAGQLLGYVGNSICADNTMPHLHIDSGGGRQSTRNKVVSDVLNGLYMQLPEGAI